MKNTKTRLTISCQQLSLLGALLCFGGYQQSLHANETLLFEPNDEQLAVKATSPDDNLYKQSLRQLATPLNINLSDKQAIIEAKSFPFMLPDGTVYEIIPDRRKVYFDRFVAVSGSLKGYGDQYSGTFVVSPAGMTADLSLPEGHFATVIEDGQTWLLDPQLNTMLNTSVISENDQLGFDDSGSFNTAIGSLQGLSIDKNGLIGGKANTVINLAIVLSTSHGLSEDAINDAMASVMMANTQLEQSGVSVTINPVLMSRVKPEFDINLNQNMLATLEQFFAQEVNFIDTDYSGLMTYPAGADNVRVHQFALFIGRSFSSSDTLCGAARGTTNTERSRGQYFTLRTARGSCSDPYTLAHELGHNMTLEHSDGAGKTFCLFGMGTGEECLDGGGGGANKRSSSGNADNDGMRSWASVMTTGVPDFTDKSFFTGGVSNNVVNEICGPRDNSEMNICNAEPFSAHNSIGILNSARTITASIFTDIDLPSTDTPTPPDFYDDISQRGYNDNIPGDAVTQFTGTTLQHNLHVQGDEDWSIQAIGSGGTLRPTATAVGSNASLRLDVYRAGSVAEISAQQTSSNPDRWSISLSQLQLLGSDTNGGSASVTFSNTGSETSVYVYRVRGVNNNVFGDGTEYEFNSSVVVTDPDEFDDISQRGYTDNAPGDAVVQNSGAVLQHNLHIQGDEDWTIQAIGAGDSVNPTATVLGSNASLKLYVYRAGTLDEIIAQQVSENPPRWDISLEQLQLIGSDTNGGSANVDFTNNGNEISIYVYKVEGANSAAFGEGTQYSFESTLQN